MKGDSATGKTVLINMIQEYLINGTDSGVELLCEVQCRVLTGNLWREQLEGISNTIVFIDEGNAFVKSTEFASEIKKTDNPSEYIESAEYFSWEQYFTALLVQLTKDSYLKYSKKKLNQNYLQPAVKEQVIRSMKGIEFE